MADRRYTPPPPLSWWERVLVALVVFAAIIALCAGIPAQEIRTANHSHMPFQGWTRTTVDVRPPHDAGTLADGTRYVLGRKTGLSTWAVDLHLELEPRELRTVQLAGATAAPVSALTLPGDPLAFFGGWATFGGIPMSIIGIEADGAGWAVHLRTRVGLTFVADVFLDWRPSEPWLATGECVITSSNPSVPDVVETVPAGGLSFLFGDGLVFGSQVAIAGERFADGQSRAVPLVIGWPRHATSAEAWLKTVPQAVALSTCAVGIRDLWPGQGNPRLPPGLDATAWTIQRFTEARRKLMTWEPGVTGANASSTDTGAQGDQVFVAAEYRDVVGPEKVAYLSALKMFNRPCHHRRPDGSLLDAAVEHPGVQWWQARPHQQSTHDLLGKERGIGSDDTSGWWGPDREHWLYNTVAAASRLTGSRALQLELEGQALLFLASEVLPGPGHGQWVTAGPDSPRAVGWACLLAIHLWHGLEDRALAVRVRDRIMARFRDVYLPAFGASDVWDVRVDDPRLGVGRRWMPWQQSVGAYGLDRLGVVFSLPAARTMALAAAKAVLRDSIYQTAAGRWQCYSNVAVDGGVPEPWNGYWLFGMPMAVATVLAHEPQNEKARAVWTQMLADAVQPGEVSWLPPETVLAPPAAPSRSSIEQWGITWTLAAPAPAGQFVNGDWWVVGPVTVASIDPPSVQLGDGRIVNGAMVNPDATGRHGYDSTLYGQYSSEQRVYTASLNVARALPRVLQPGTSLVSTISQIGPASNGSPSEIRTAAVLTVLSAPPPPDAFRPPYAGIEKHLWREADLDAGALAQLPAVPGAPGWSATAAGFDRVWLDHCTHWTSGRMHPVDNMPSYYRDFTALVGDAALLLNTAAAWDTKRDLAVRLVQLGIDNWGVYRAGGGPWGVNGHCNGRKFPILFAGRMLGDAVLLGVGAAHPVQFFGPGDPRNRVPQWSEDGQVFYVAETSPGVFNWGFGGYTAAHVGLPEWGNFHAQGDAQNLASDYSSWFPPPGRGDYRRCCSANAWPGVTLAMRAMGLRDAWNQPAFFDYMDRYMQTEPAGQWTRSWEPWQERMWDAHRGAL